MLVTCATCSKEFDRPRWHAERTQIHYCSKACKHPPFIFDCEWCGATKRVPPSAKKDHNFCSRQCCRAWQGANGIVAASSRITVACATCGKLLELQPNQINRSAQNYCGRDCFAEAHRHRMTGNLNPAWRGGFEPYYGPNWRQQARRARVRDGHACRRCGVAESSLDKSLHVHHIVPLRAFRRDFRRANALSNLVSLCPACHKYLEWHADQMQAFITQLRQP